MESTPRGAWWAGVRAELPILVGVIPFGMIYGALALAAGIPPATAQAMSSVVFAGSAQFITAQLYGEGAPLLVIVLTGAVVNLRHMLYSASLAPYLRPLNAGWKWLLAYLLTDEAYAVTVLHYQEVGADPPRYRTAHWFYLGAGLALWSTWQLSTAVGIFLGGQVPESRSLSFTLPLTFIALVVPALRDRPAAAAAQAAGGTPLLAAGWPFKLGLLAAALVGILVGMWLEGRA